MQANHPDDEVKRLQRCVSDLISVTALPALWSGGDPAQIARTLIDVLPHMLQLDLIYVRLTDPLGETCAELARSAESPASAQPDEIRAQLNRLLGNDPHKWPSRTHGRLGAGNLSLVPVRLGLQGEIGMLVAGAARLDFPGQTDELLLRVAANQAVISLHEVRLRDEQKRLAEELDQRVAQRTRELRHSELNLRQLTETIPEMLWSATPDGAIDYCNTRLLDYTGFTAEEIIGDGWTRLIHPDDVDPAVEEWNSSITSGAPFRVEVRALHGSDGMYRWCVMNALPLIDQDGSVLKWHGTVVDMHDWKQAQDALRNTQAELANMSRVMTMAQLTASIAHEVNQPLSGIITNASTCLRMLDANPPNVEGARETARRTIRDGNRAADVITRLRALFSKRPAATESVDLNEALREVIALLLGKLQSACVIVRSELADDLPRVAGDRVQLQQVIMNLLQNAAEAMIDVNDRPRQLLIQTQQDGTDHVRLAVQDSGPGLDPQESGRVFDAFYTTKSGGMGIGLAVSRSIIENHQGRICVRPNDGPGTTFSFTIPRCPRSEFDESRSTSPEIPATHQAVEVARNL